MKSMVLMKLGDGGDSSRFFAFVMWKIEIVIEVYLKSFGLPEVGWHQEFEVKLSPHQQ